MPFAVTGPPADAAAQLIAHLERTGMLDTSGNVAESAVAELTQAPCRSTPYSLSYAKQTGGHAAPPPCEGQGDAAVGR